MNAPSRNVVSRHAIFVLLLLMLAACGNSSVSSSPSSMSKRGQTLHVLVGSGYVTQQKQWMEKVSADFQKITGCTVAFDTYASTNDEQTKLQTAIASGSGPDIFSLGTSFVPTAQATGGFNVSER